MTATLPTMANLREALARRPFLFRVPALLALSCLCFYIGKRWATRYEELVVYNSTLPPGLRPSEPHVTLVTDYHEETEDPSSKSSASAPPRVVVYNSTLPPGLRPSEPHVTLVTDYHEETEDPSSKSSASAPPRVVVSPTGVLREDGSIITKEFPMNDDGGTVPSDDESINFGNTQVPGDADLHGKKKSIKFKVCPSSMKEYIPCLDNVAAIKQLASNRKGEKWERHCPLGEAANLGCLIPAPAHYRYPIRWPKSRDEVWYSNVPHTRLVEDKGGQNWMVIKKDKFIFPGGGTQFAHGADQYLDQMEKMVPDIAFGHHTRVALDIGCGVASWGAYLMSRNVLTLSIAPKDVHENQIQFALERGVPAMVAALATRRLLYPSQAFDIIHCSRCRIEWTHDGGILLVEVDRVLRGGGFFAWAAQPVYKHEGNLPEEWHAMVNLTERLCWTLVAKEGYLAIWKKPLDNTCHENRPLGTEPPLCDTENDPDNVWYVSMPACITRLPQVSVQHNVSDWPARLHIPPNRLLGVKTDAKEAKQEAFIAEERYMKEIVRGYQHGLGLKLGEIRNVMDMNAGYGGFAAAVSDSEADWWVMNIVPINGSNTLPVIYDRGLIGVAHDWCESFDTYPRTYDLLHAAGLFTLGKIRCSVARIVLEMDRILRPGGSALIRDSIDVIQEIESIAKVIRWNTRVLDTDSGPYGKDRLLSCKKRLWHA